MHPNTETSVQRSWGATGLPGIPFDLLGFLVDQRQWSASTFGPSPRTQGIIDHLKKELIEVGENPNDLGEWVDLVILALDGAWRHGHAPKDIILAMQAKMRKNEGRTWPDWRTLSENAAIEHDRSADTATDHGHEDEHAQFLAAAMPLMEYLRKHRHPHTHAVVDSGNSELLEGVLCARNPNLK